MHKSADSKPKSPIAELKHIGFLNRLLGHKNAYDPHAEPYGEHPHLPFTAGGKE